MSRILLLPFSKASEKCAQTTRRYTSEIRVLQQAQQREWQEKREHLRMRLNDLMARRERNLTASLEVPK